MTQCLNYAVAGPLNRSEPGAQTVSRLMMGAVHKVWVPEQGAQRGRRGLDSVKAISFRQSVMAGNVLEQGASEKDVDDLKAPADA